MYGVKVIIMGFTVKMHGMWYTTHVRQVYYAKECDKSAIFFNNLKC